MHFPLVVGVILVCLTIACNGQFKILGLLDTNSEINKGKVENIRSLDDFVEDFSSYKDAPEISGITESEIVLEKSEKNKENVNFIKPYETVTSELKNDFSDATTSTSGAAANNVLIPDEAVDSENVSSKDVASETIPDSDVVPSLESSTMSSTTTIATKQTELLPRKTYRKNFQPNIRKFSHLEARSYHHPDSPNHVTPSSRWNNYKFIKVLKYRNKYKSKCRCERIWNCPKIQISIQRCEPDYFMCCF